VQYHPEFDLHQLAQLYTLYADDMVRQGFFASNNDLTTYSEQLTRLADNPTDAGLAWQLGMDEDVLDDKRRRSEIIAWIETCVLKRG
jgi:GMP synthase (glutamine-hydrolysing)